MNIHCDKYIGTWAFSLFLCCLLLSSCATYTPQYIDQPSSNTSNQEIAHTIVVAGGLGNSRGELPQAMINKLKSELATVDKNSTVLFTGDNISKDKESWDKDLQFVNQHLKLTENFKGTVTFLPGNNEWKSKNIDTIQKVEDYLQDDRGLEDYVLPENGCPLEYRVINENLDMILINSKWFISNWSIFPLNIKRK